MKKILIVLFVFISVLIVVSCSKSNPTADTEATATLTPNITQTAIYLQTAGPAAQQTATAEAAANLTGIWTGSMSDSSGPGTGTLNITQTGQDVSGSFTMSTLSGSITGTGTISGTISGTTLSCTMYVPPGGINSSLYSTCSINVTGFADLTNTKMTGTYTGNNSCGGAFTNGVMIFNKQ